MFRMTVLVIGMLGILSGQALAWNSRGHMMVAAIAWQQLDPATKEKVAELLKLNPSYSDWIAGAAPGTESQIAFVKAATWPDAIKKDSDYTNDGEDPSVPNSDRNIGYQDKLQHRYWHYIDLPFSDDGTALQQPRSPNAKTQIEAFRDTLASSANDDTKSYDVVWLLHLVGDVHQPLHATSRFSAGLPDGDRGGNAVMLCAKPCKSELHAFWDAAAGTGDSATAAIKAVSKSHKVVDANDLNSDFHAAKSQAEDNNVDDWIAESFELAKADAYVDPIGEGTGPFELTEDYKANAKSIAKRRIALAGARLARLLNENLR